ncbi:MAG: transposase [Fimbriimonadia bacterium]|nr:transposase [Fimbriimonadia bacterium]
MKKSASGGFDSPWKEALEFYFYEFLGLCFPQVYALIDTQRDPVFLDKELQELFPQSQTNRLIVDKLVKVFAAEGDELWILIHVEVQSQQTAQFPERMWYYYATLKIHYRKPTISLAVLTDSNPRWRPDSHEEELGGCKSRLDFPMVKIIDYENRTDELIDSSNPFSVIILAHLEALKTKNSFDLRFESRWRLTRMLYERGYTKEQVRQLYRFVGWLLELPEDLTEVFKMRLHTYEEETKMPYIVDTERLAIKEGLTKGRKEGLQKGLQKGLYKEAHDALIDVLTARFGRIPADIRKQLKENRDLETLRKWRKIALTAPSIDAFKESMS